MNNQREHTMAINDGSNDNSHHWRVIKVNDDGPMSARWGFSECAQDDTIVGVSVVRAGMS